MMLRLIVTLAVGFALLVGLGAWFDPEGAREAIRRDLAGLAGQAADRAEDVVRDVVELAAVKAAEEPAAAPTSAPSAAGKSEPSTEPPSEPAAGPRTGKKRRPVIADVPDLSAPDSPVETEEVEEVALVAPGEFVEAPLEEPQQEEAPENERTPAVHSGRAPRGLEQAPPDVAEQGVLIRRMLALYQRMGERR